MNKYLPIVFGCHCRSDRSFSYKGKQFPICARCTGELIGFLLAPMAWFLYRPPIVVLVLMILPLMADGIIQKATSYESTNIRRVITGALFGYAAMTLFLMSVVAVVRKGFQLGLKMKY